MQKIPRTNGKYDWIDRVRPRPFFINRPGLMSVIYSLHVHAHPKWTGGEVQRDFARNALRLLKGRETAEELAARIDRENKAVSKTFFGRIYLFFNPLP